MRRLRLLFVDDSEDFRLMMPMMYSSLPSVAEVKTAANLADALSALGGYDADIVFIDSMMPGVSGEVVAEEIRAAHPDTRLVALTGLPSSEATWSDETITKGAHAFDEVRRLLEAASEDA